MDVQPQDRPDFGITVDPGGYAWWYLDALSGDGTEGLTIISLLGSVFSPYYAWSGRKDPLDHSTMNVVLYNRRGGRWAMTERGRQDVERSADALRIGTSQIQWDGQGVVLDVDESTFPLPGRIQGRIRLRPDGVNSHRVALDDEGRHLWWPIAPRARVEVELQRPSLRWSGVGYFDSNWGTTPLETPFKEWNWSRVSTAQGSAIFYDVERRNRPPLEVALRFDAQNKVETVASPAKAPLAGTLWGVPRTTRADRSDLAKVTRTLEDTPFYTRSVVESTLFGQTCESVHESLSLDRFRTQWVKLLLPFRMPRRPGVPRRPLPAWAGAKDRDSAASP
ncbi:MAG: carotenoid 1,2-hydratase [Myxococcota bacterium]